MNQSYIEQINGGYYIKGTRVSLDSVVYRWLEGLSPDTIADCFPALTLEQTYGAIAYYLGHRAEIDAYLKAANEEYETFRQRIRASYARLSSRLDDLLDAENLLEIKRGEWSIERVKAEAERLFKLAEEAYVRSSLPAKPDTQKAENLCMEIISHYHELKL
ncbi:MAG: DUF433 domain-containing protein [Acidobacteria bacterium]|nr:DUF433 domain-containing protein [Acidobacteriota bacterium]